MSATARHPDPTGGAVGPVDAAREAIARMAALQAEHDLWREYRDAAIVAMHQAGAKPPAIARALGVSTSLIRLTLKVGERPPG